MVCHQRRVLFHVLYYRTYAAMLISFLFCECRSHFGFLPVRCIVLALRSSTLHRLKYPVVFYVLFFKLYRQCRMLMYRQQVADVLVHCSCCIRDGIPNNADRAGGAASGRP